MEGLIGATLGIAMGLFILTGMKRCTDADRVEEARQKQVMEICDAVCAPYFAHDSNRFLKDGSCVCDQTRRKVKGKNG